MDEYDLNGNGKLDPEEKAIMLEDRRRTRAGAAVAEHRLRHFLDRVDHRPHRLRGHAHRPDRDLADFHPHLFGRLLDDGKRRLVRRFAIGTVADDRLEAGGLDGGQVLDGNLT